MSDIEPADVWNETIRTARKEHHCISGLCISKGHQYVDITYLADGSWTRFRMRKEFKKLFDKENCESDYSMTYENWSEIETIKFWVDMMGLYQKIGGKLITRQFVFHRYNELSDRKAIRELEARVYDLEQELDKLKGKKAC